jgi:hypothetical protein
MSTDEPDRAEALALLQAFGARVLPGTLRRIAAWKRLGRGELPQLTEDLLQELAIDCLLHARTIVALPPGPRHARWMRMAERWVYRHHVRPRIPPAVPAGVPAPIGATTALPDAPDHWVRLGNGRWNLTASAVRDRRPLAALQNEVECLVVRLGCDGEHDAFWRARLAEALTGLGADLLRQRGGLLLLPAARAAVDPQRHLRRIRALGRRFHVRPSTIAVRRIVRRWTQRPPLADPDAARQVLQDAARVWPRSPVVWPWLGEACLAAGDARGALQAVRAQGRLRPRQRGRAVLLRARVLELRGRWRAAVQLLSRSARRWPHEARLRQALAAVQRRR